jgi:hypothetical protein
MTGNMFCWWAPPMGRPMKERACPLGRAMLLAHAYPSGLAMFLIHAAPPHGGDDLVHAALLVFALPLVFCFAHLTRTASALDG